MEALEVAGLSGFENVYPSELSGDEAEGWHCEGAGAAAAGPPYGRAIQLARRPDR